MGERIMYACSICADENPEGCGHFDRNDLRVLPDGRWLCEGCFDDATPADRGTIPDDDGGEDTRGWFDLPAPVEYVPQPALVVGTPRDSAPSSQSADSAGAQTGGSK